MAMIFANTEQNWPSLNIKTISHLHCNKESFIVKAGPVYIVTLPLQCRWPVYKLRRIFHIPLYLQRLLLCLKATSAQIFGKYLSKVKQYIGITKLAG